MSISLKNHEDRITALEAGRKISKTLLWSGLIESNYEGQPLVLSQPIDNFDFLLIMVSTYQQRNTNVFKQQFFLVDQIIKNSYSFQCDTGLRQILFKRKDATTYGTVNAVSALITDMPGEYTVMGAVRQVYGLKIYYIFRYNIKQILKLISPILKF